MPYLSTRPLLRLSLALLVAASATTAALGQTFGDRSTNDDYRSNNSAPSSDDSRGDTPQGPVRLRSSTSSLKDQGYRDDQQQQQQQQPYPDSSRPPYPAPYVPGEFERYVQLQVDAGPNQPEIRRFGASLVTDLATPGSSEPLPAVPADYVIKPGDEVLLTVWGSVDADLRLIVDRAGRISLPRVGSVQVAGLRSAELQDALRSRVAKVFRNFELTATLGQVRPVRVFVTGFAQRPGSLTIGALSSVLHVVMRSGGPSSAGSFRDITLRRGGKEVSHFDLYDLLLNGNRSADQIVQPDDVIHIGPVGPQIGVIGSVNNAAVFELKEGETLNDAIRMAGGFNAVADRTRVAIEPLSDRIAGRVAEWPLPQSLGQRLGSGDLVRIFSAITAALPRDKQRKRVRVEGEVLRPGDYVLPPGSGIHDALAAAGGLSPAAYLFGTDFSRESVRVAQQESYDRALRDLETEMAKFQAGRRVSTAEEAAAQTTGATANAHLLERLRKIRPTGRVVLQIEPDAVQLPNMALEDGDRLMIPARATSIGVFGSVFSSGNYIYETGSTVGHYVELSGGPTRGADKGSIFLVRANGAVISSQQGDSFFKKGILQSAAALPGDTVFVPEEMDKTTFTQNAKDWTQILYQFGLGMAGIAALGL